MSLAFLFPGQGSQRVGMGADVFELFPELVAEADAILGYSISTLCLEGPEDRLGQTQFTQPSLYVVSYLTALAKVSEGQAPTVAAGHSVGEFAALALSKAFSFADGLRMVAKRGEIMAKVSGGGMAAVIGLEAVGIEETLSSNDLNQVDLANFNSPGQIGVSGPAASVEMAVPLLKEAGAKLVVPLKVSGAFHSHMMKEPSLEFAEFIKTFTFSAPSFPVFANVHALAYDKPEEIPERLVLQMRRPVRWTETITNLRSSGVSEFLECGPGNVLTKLLRQIP